MKFKNTLIIVTMFLFMMVFAFADTELTGCQEINISDTYYLNGTLDASAFTDRYGQCIDINVDNVEIDCMGNTITGNPTNVGYETFYVNGVENITIKNCNIEGGIRGVVVDTSNNVQILNNTFRDILFVGGDNVGYALEVTGAITSPVLFYNNTVTDSDAFLSLSHALTDNTNVDVYHNNLLELTTPVTIYPYDNAKGRITIRNNAYNLAEACIDFGEDGNCDTSYGSIFFIDTLPIQCIDGWRGGTSGCSYSRFQYSEGDLSNVAFDIIIKAVLILSAFIFVVVLFLGATYGIKKIKE